jgi:hypothetical protein
VIFEWLSRSTRRDLPACLCAMADMLSKRQPYLRKDGTRRDLVTRSGDGKHDRDNDPKEAAKIVAEVDRQAAHNYINKAKHEKEAIDLVLAMKKIDAEMSRINERYLPLCRLRSTRRSRKFKTCRTSRTEQRCERLSVPLTPLCPSLIPFANCHCAPGYCKHRTIETSVQECTELTARSPRLQWWSWLDSFPHFIETRVLDGAEHEGIRQPP